MYPSEFPGAAYDPVDAPLFFSLSPALLLLILLLVLLALACGWYGRERLGPRPHDPCQAIYDAVRKAAEEALKASRDDVHGKARRLVEVVERRLGGVMALAEGLDSPWRDIRAVLDPEPKKPDAEPGHGDKDRAHGKDARPAAPELVVVNTGKMVVHAGGVREALADDPKTSPHEQGEHGKLHVSPAPEPDRRDEVARLRAALHAFADHWRDRPRRLAELRRARADLT